MCCSNSALTALSAGAPREAALLASWAPSAPSAGALFSHRLAAASRLPRGPNTHPIKLDFLRFQSHRSRYGTQCALSVTGSWILSPLPYRSHSLSLCSEPQNISLAQLAAHNAAILRRCTASIVIIGDSSLIRNSRLVADCRGLYFY
jgi:hypothetical protein